MTIELVERILSPLSIETFVDDHLDKTWSKIDGGKGKRLDEFFSIDDVERYLFITRPWERQGNGGSERLLRFVTPETDEPDAPVDGLEDTMRRFASGSTLVLQQAHQRWPVLARLCSALATTFSCHVTANVYCTPPSKQGFRTHFDKHDVLVLQTTGTKHWRVHPVERRLPAAVDPFPGEVEPETPNALEVSRVTMKTNDVLYLPRGTPHDALAGDEVSLHVTLGLYPVCWYQVAHAVVDARLRRDVELRRRVPSELLRDPAKLLASMPAWLRSGLEEGDLGIEIDEVVDRLHRGSQLLLPDDGIASIRKADTLTTASALRLRGGSEMRWGVRQGKPWLSLCGKEVALHPKTVPFLEYLEGHSEFLVGDLPEEFTSESKVAFARWLVRQGFAVVAGAGAGRRLR